MCVCVRHRDWLNMVHNMTRLAHFVNKYTLCYWDSINFDELSYNVIVHSAADTQLESRHFANVRRVWFDPVTISRQKVFQDCFKNCCGDNGVGRDYF